MKRKSLVRAAWVAACSVVGGSAAMSQAVAPGPLTTFVDTAAGATQGQVNVGVAVQNMCSYLGAQGYKATSPAATLATPQGDLFLRCNELVQTARGILAQPGATTRSLGVNSAGLLGAVQQISGEELAAQGTLATQVPSGQFANITSRINSLRYGFTGASMRGHVTALNSSSDDGSAPITDTFHYSSPLMQLSHYYADEADGAVGLRPASYRYAADDSASGNTASASALPRTPNPWGIFTEGTYNFGKRDQSPDDDAFKYHSESVTAGIDYNFGNAVAGASIGYDYYKATFDSNGVTVSGGEDRVEGTTGSLFAAWFGTHWNFNGIASYGSLNTDLVRVVAYAPVPGACSTPTLPGCGATRSLRGTPDGKVFSLGGTAGYDVNAGPLLLTPSLSATYRHVKIDSYTETDLSAPAGGSGLPLAYADQSIDSFRSILGFTAAMPLSQSFGVLSPYFRAEWDHEFRNSSRNLDARYAADPSPGCVSCFVIPTERPDSDFGVVGAGLSAIFSNRLQAYFSYERLVGVSYLTSNAITLGVRGQF